MANEAQVRCSLQITKGNLEYHGKPTMFNADVAGIKGPVPGAIQVALAGTDVDFGELTTPSLCRLQNLDATNYVVYGIRDPELSQFYPLGELLAGESYVLRLSRDLQEQYGTGTDPDAPLASNRLHLIARGAACEVLVEAFEV